MKKIWVLFIIVIFSWCFSREMAIANTQSAELQQVRQQITTVKQSLNNIAEEREKFLRTLEESQNSVNALSTQLNTINQQLIEKKNLLEALRQKQQRLRQNLESQQERLVEQLRVAYVVGQQPALKLLLNQQNHHDLDRTLGYYRYLSKAQLQNIEDIYQTLPQLRATEEKVTMESGQLQLMQAEVLNKQQRLQNIRQEHERLLSGLNHQLSSGQQRLKELNRNEQALQNLVMNLGKNANSVSIPNTTRVPMSALPKLPGQFSLPTTGKIVEHFGELFQGHLTRKGIFIQAPEGQQVQALYAGKVVFADTLRGFGLLVIVEHPENYLSLYGHNQSVAKKVGDIVKTGEVIASVGKVSDHIQSGLYFELRHKGYPIDPEAWFKHVRGS